MAIETQIERDLQTRNRGYALLAAAIIHRAAADYHIRKYKNDVEKFLKTEWFEFLCDEIQLSPEEVKKMIKNARKENIPKSLIPTYDSLENKRENLYDSFEITHNIYNAYMILRKKPPTCEICGKPFTIGDKVRNIVPGGMQRNRLLRGKSPLPTFSCEHHKIGAVKLEQDVFLYIRSGKLHKTLKLTFDYSTRCFSRTKFKKILSEYEAFNLEFLKQFVPEEKAREILRGRIRPPKEAIQKIARTLGVHMRHFFDDECILKINHRLSRKGSRNAQS
ncbi:MAG: hypothetical protein KM296_00045 [Brockia lithotrophica]|nr:hypothetical protein [Brockia lithotrophica]